MGDEDVERVVAACRLLPEPRGNYLEDDFLVNLVATVVDFQTDTTAVVRAIGHFRDEVRPGLLGVEDLVDLLARFPAAPVGNVELARHLWGYRVWTRAQLLRDPVAFFVSVGVTDQEKLRTWAETTTFDDFEGKVPGLGRAVYHWLVMRVGVDPVKPDVHVLRFVEAAVGRPVGDVDAVRAVTEAARRLGRPVLRVDWAIWEAGRTGPAPTTRPANARRVARRPPPAPSRRREHDGDPGAATIGMHDGAVVSFVDDDPGYLASIATNPGGFVVNSAPRPRPTYLVLHRATCRTISGAPARGRTFTSAYRKTCAAEIATVRAWAEAVAPPTLCRWCDPVGGKARAVASSCIRLRRGGLTRSTGRRRSADRHLGRTGRGRSGRRAAAVPARARDRWAAKARATGRPRVATPATSATSGSPSRLR